MTLRVVEWLSFLVMGAAGLGIVLRWRIRHPLDRILAVLAPMGVVAILVHLIEALASGPELEMNASRVANAVAMARGHDIFLTVDQGPLLDFMYGPMFVVAYTPAALAASATGAIWIGVVLSLLFVLVPFAILAFRYPGQPSRLTASVAVVCFGLLCTWDSGLWWVAWHIMADAPALALAGSACAGLLSCRGTPSTRRLIVVSLCAALAVWSKQTMAPLVLALPLYAWMRSDLRAALRFVGILGITGLVVSLVFVLWLGFDDLLFNLFLVPGGHPWKGSLTGGSRLQDAVVSLRRMAGIAGPAALAAVAIAATSIRSGVPLRQWIREHPWTGLAWVALLMVPTCVMAGAKIGGEANVYAISTYFLTGAVVLGLAQATTTDAIQVRTASRMLLAAVLLFGVGMEMLRPQRYLALRTAVEQLRHWHDNPQERAVAFARAHPDEVHFIGNPLIGLYSDGRLYSDMFGRYDRELAGYRPKPELMLQYAPPKLRYLASRANFPWFTKPSMFPEYPNFTKPVAVAELPDHVVWERP